MAEVLFWSIHFSCFDTDLWTRNTSKSVSTLMTSFALAIEKAAPGSSTRLSSQMAAKERAI